jgi:hypothetical protein
LKAQFPEPTAICHFFLACFDLEFSLGSLECLLPDAVRLGLDFHLVGVALAGSENLAQKINGIIDGAMRFRWFWRVPPGGAVIRERVANGAW